VFAQLIAARLWLGAQRGLALVFKLTQFVGGEFQMYMRRPRRSGWRMRQSWPPRRRLAALPPSGPEPQAARPAATPSERRSASRHLRRLRRGFAAARMRTQRIVVRIVSHTHLCSASSFTLSELSLGLCRMFFATELACHRECSLHCPL
jgi:hypothetical protein